MSRSCTSCRSSVPNFSKFCTKCGTIFRQAPPSQPQPSRPGNQTPAQKSASQERPTRAWQSSKGSASSGSGQSHNPPPQNNQTRQTPAPVTPPLPPALQNQKVEKSGGSGKWIVAIVLCFVAPPVGLLMLGYLIFFDK